MMMIFIFPFFYAQAQASWEILSISVQTNESDRESTQVPVTPQKNKFCPHSADS